MTIDKRERDWKTRGVLWPPSHTINTHKAVNSLIRGALRARPAKWMAGEDWNVCKRLLLDGNYLNDTDGQDRVFLFT